MISQTAQATQDIHGQAAKDIHERTMKPFTGTNGYYFLTYAGDQGTRSTVIQSLDAIKNMGLNVVRIWAFGDGPGWNYLQPKAGQYDQKVLAGLDWLLDEAKKRDLQLTMVLTNGNPHEYGGMRQYVRWANNLPDNAEVSNGAFYFNDKAQQLCKNFMTMIVTRYRGHPAVHSWDLVNEPRNEGDTTGALARWIDATAAHVRSLDPKHPITVGLDGFFGPSTPDLMSSANPYSMPNNSMHGTDFVRDCKSLDYACIHLYADQWRTAHPEDQWRWSLGWVDAHIKACRERLGGKPLVLQEYNLKPAGPARVELFKGVADRLVQNTKTKGPFQGAVVWMVTSPAYSYDDGYNLYPNANDVNQAATEALRGMCRDMNALNRPMPAVAKL